MGEWVISQEALDAANAALAEYGAKADAYLATLPDDDDIDQMIREHLVDPADIDQMIADCEPDPDVIAQMLRDGEVAERELQSWSGGQGDVVAEMLEGL